MHGNVAITTLAYRQALMRAPSQKTNPLRGLTWACIGLLSTACAGTPRDPGHRSEQVQASFVVAETHSASFTDFAVAADEAQASAAGAEILARGGNAADAAAAVMLALGVSSFASSGLGGGGFALYYRSNDRSVAFLDFRERAPNAASADMFDKAPAAKSSGPFSAQSQLGGLAVAVPGEPAGIEALLTEYGSLSRQAVTAPAIRLAERGFRISERVASMSQWLAGDLGKDPHVRSLLGDNPKGFVAGSTLKRPVLAKTLRVFAAQGARPFYHGAIAKDIIESVQRNGGIMQLRDLAAYRVKKRKPLQADAFGYRWITAPPPSAGGYILLSSLALLDQWSNEQPIASPVSLLHAFAESFKGPFIDRSSYFGDPDFVTVPLFDLLNTERIMRRAAVFNRTRSVAPKRYGLPLSESDDHAFASHAGGTAHFCVVDKHGNVASVTTTINLPFGARITAAGMFLNDQMDDFVSRTGSANAFRLSADQANFPAPNKRPVSSATPSIVFKNSQPVLCIGGVGGSRIVTSVVQVAYYTLVAGESPATAIVRPRIHHQAEPNLLFHEDLGSDKLSELKRLGHKVEKSEHAGVVQMIHITHQGSRLEAASDPRKGGRPAGR